MDGIPDLIVPAPAKLNLFLHVVGRRPDGYHELESLMVLLDFGDSIRLQSREDGEIQLLTPLANVPPEDDLCIRAARLLQCESRCALGVEMQVLKRIPLGSGMGGGSSDAASVLLALNRLWNLRLHRADLMKMGERLGADVPFFIFGRSAIARGVGERLTEVSLPLISVEIAVPPVPVSTQLIFQAPELRRNTARIGQTAFALDFGRNDLEAVAAVYFEEIARCAEVFGGNRKGYNERDFPRMVRMTGSGGAVFRILAELACESQERPYTEELPAGTRYVKARTLARHPLCGFAEG